MHRAAPFFALASLLFTGAAAADAPLATWQGGGISRQEYDTWLQDLGLEDAGLEETGEQLSRFFLVTTLAEAGRGRGLAQTPLYRISREAAEQRLAIVALQKHIEGEVNVSEEDVETLARENPSAFHRPRKMRLQNLYKALEPEEQEEAIRCRMAEIHAELLAGAPFGDLARRESESQTRFREGKAGWIDPLTLPAPAGPIVAALKPGQVTEPLEFRGGLTIFRCEEIREAVALSPEELRERLRDRLLVVGRSQRWESYRDGLFSQARPILDAQASDVVARWEEYRLTRPELLALEEMRRSAERTGSPDSSPGGDPGGDSGDRPDAAALQGLLKTWMGRVILARKANELGLGNDPKARAFLHWKELELLAKWELEERVRARQGKPSEEELRAHLAANSRRFQTVPRVALAAIQLAKGKGPYDRATWSDAVRVARQLETGEVSFEEAARLHSIHPSSAAGGLLGWRSRRQLVNLGSIAIQALRQVKPGEITGLLHLESGLWILQILEEEEAKPRPFEDVRSELEAELLEKQRRELLPLLEQEHLEALGFRILPPAEPRIVSWSTATEFESYGFHVYRGVAEDGPFERLTAEIVPGAGTTDIPQDYRFEDHSADPTRTYFYYVEAISTSGGSRRLTPILAVPPKTAPSDETP